MNKLTTLEMSPEELRANAEKFKKNGKIFLMIGVCTLPIFIGIIFLIIGGSFYASAKMNTKLAEKTEKELNTPIREYIIFDFETNGLNPKTNRVIEIGALKIKDGIIVDKFSSLVNPQKNITKKIADLTGITTEMLIDAPLESDVFKDFANFIRGYTLTAYNVNFDIGFLDETLKRIGIGLGSVNYFDTMKIARNQFKNLENYKLETVVKHLNPEFEQSHRALDDCYAIKNILDNVTLTKAVLS